MKNKISTSSLIWKDRGFTKVHYWFNEILISGFIISGMALLIYVFTSRNASTYETLHILVLIAVGLFLGGIVTSLSAIFELLFILGADRLGLLSKENKEEKEES